MATPAAAAETKLSEPKATTTESKLSPAMAKLADRIRGSLFGLFIGDALAMPAHWYYDASLIPRHYGGKITGYVAPKTHLPGSIMNLSNTGGGGRGSDSSKLVGDVIMKGKHKFWARGGEYHYHQGMRAGENTLDVHITRVLMRSLIKNKGNLDVAAFRNDYIEFMTKEGSHNDTYCNTYHRMFFANYVKGKSPADCPDNDGHNTDGIDAMSLVPPVAFAFMEATEAQKKKVAEESMNLMRRSKILPGFARVLEGLILSVSRGEEVKKAVTETGKLLGLDVPRMVASSYGDPMTACYVSSAFPALLHYAYKYSDDFEKALLASTNAGGENVARGAALGAVLGAAHGMKGIPKHLVEGLYSYKELSQEIDQFVDICVSKMTPAAL